jgi:hypothetical protein
MAVPRPVLLLLLGVALCSAAFLATRGAQDPGGAITSVPTPAPATPAPAAKAHAAKAAKAHKATKHAAKPAPAAKHPAAAKHPKAAATIPGVQEAVNEAAPATAKPAQPAKPAVPKAEATAVRVRVALQKGEAVVFFFTRAGPADDTGTRGAVQALHSVKHVLVVKAGLQDLTAFRPVLSGAGVSQVPSIVIVHKGQKARLLEGYVDRGTLRQNVADALR